MGRNQKDLIIKKLGGAERLANILINLIPWINWCVMHILVIN